MKITVKDAIDLLQYCDKIPVTDVRLMHALGKNVTLLKPFYDDHLEDIEMEEIKYASEKDGFLIKSPLGYDYTKEDSQKLLKAKKKLLKEKVEFTPEKLPVIKELLSLGNGALAILDPLLPEKFIDELEKLQKKQEK